MHPKSLLNHAVYFTFGLFYSAASIMACDNLDSALKYEKFTYQRADLSCTVTKEHSALFISEREECKTEDSKSENNTNHKPRVVSRLIEMYENGAFKSSTYKEHDPRKIFCRFKYYEADLDNDSRTETARSEWSICIDGKVREFFSRKKDDLGVSTLRITYYPDRPSVMEVDNNGDGMIDAVY